MRERTQADLAAARARGRRRRRPRTMIPTTLRIVMTARAEHTTHVTDVATYLGLDRTTLDLSVNGDGSPKALGQALLTGQDEALLAAHRLATALA